MSSVEHKIRVHDKVLAHLSKGLYRSPASALRELVSNAWDANATRVRITTSYPNFLQVTVADNGDGFDRDAFMKHMEGDIGNSAKRDVNLSLVHERPVIGRLGIGLLGIAQICHGFRIASVPKSGRPFQARVVLEDNLKERLDANDAELVMKSDGKAPNFEIGRFYEEELTIPVDGSGTVVVADDVHAAFARSFQDSLNLEAYVQPPMSWAQCLDVLETKQSLQQLGEYWRLLWELAASCPIPYLASDCVPDDLVDEYQGKLTSYDFKVFVDGRQLYKPVRLQGSTHGYTSTPVSFSRAVYGKNLEVGGYVVAQEGKSLRPDELRGVLIRIKNVGIGYYDQTLLDYRINEGPRSRWITGELLVSAGLEDALNIDRDSFNKFDPEYRTLQEFVHSLLQTSIFSALYKNIDVRSNHRAEEKAEQRQVALFACLEGIFDQFEFDRRKATNAAKRILRQSPSDSELQTRKTNRTLAAAVLALHRASNETTDTELGRRAFQSALLQLLKEW